jgi:Domain of unknown function (DUF4397)
MITRFFSSRSLLGLLVLSATACAADTSAIEGDESVIDEQASELRTARMAKVRVVHASPDAPRVDVYAEGVAEPLIKGIGFGETSAYLRLPAGTYNVQLRAAPSTSADPVAYSTGPLTITSGAKITAVASGLLGSKDAASAFRVLPLAEKFGKRSSDARVRIVHASADAPTVGIDVGNDTPNAHEVAALNRFADTGADGVSLPSGAALQVGITAGGNRVTAFTTPALPASANLFVIATGLLAKQPREGSGFALLAVGPNGTIGFIKQNPKVYALHGVQSLGPVDIFAGNAELVSNLDVNNLSAGVQVPPGAYSLDFFPAAAGSKRPAGSAAATLTTGELGAGQKYLAVASGIAAPGYRSPVTLSAYVDGFDLSSAAQGKSQIRAVHSAPSVGVVNVGVANATASGISNKLISGLNYRESTAALGLAVAPGAYRLGIEAPSDLISFFLGAYDFALPAAGRSFVVVTGTLQSPRGSRFPRPFVIDTTKSEWTLSTPAFVPASGH